MGFCEPYHQASRLIGRERDIGQVPENIIVSFDVLFAFHEYQSRETFAIPEVRRST